MRRRAIGGRGFAILLFGAAALCLATPFIQIAGQDEGGMLYDSMAWFGAGTLEGAPTVHQVSCSSRRHGSTRPGGFGISDWDCRLMLAPARRPAAPNPYAGMTREQARIESRRLWDEYVERLRNGPRLKSSLTRALASNRNGDIPELRWISGEGEDARYGVVWSGSELAGRWLRWSLMAALLWVAGAFLIFSAKARWRRSRENGGIILGLEPR